MSKKLSNDVRERIDKLVDREIIYSLETLKNKIRSTDVLNNRFFLSDREYKLMEVIDEVVWFYQHKE